MKGTNNIINNIINVVENLGDSTRSICKQFANDQVLGNATKCHVL